MSHEYNQANVDRFLGFQDEYDRNRPKAPLLVTQLLSNYTGGRPSLVVDIGCGTGLSTFAWQGKADRIIGVEPSSDMIGKARTKLLDYAGSQITFVQGYSHQLDLPAGSADIITCSQSFHWMEPQSTLNEAARVLREGGIFAAYDCDWPPVLQWDVEAAYSQLIQKADRLAAELAEPSARASKRDKEQHLLHIQESGLFRYCREIVFHNTEPCNAERYIGILLSQGGLQSALKLGTQALDEDLQYFRGLVEQAFQERTLDILFSYRMRLGIK
ncbi:class I SAM-dependent methyltransferase [Paenibacillus sp. JX-17]|uniref:Class I SAM-dependent methyltransferase n=1 Tax=Paenibacillus lacisoli TaxID=3064525 RepID=A0ABT9CG00_9BACL|nr:class I SAM-dependent methyltransferase [Paenibacillus sp. JX-17]MDO7908209.1 class I SAM-dependent methyltransferase [Paenibacillus sp. JX-17]